MARIEPTLVIDEDLLLAHRVGQVEATLAGAVAAVCQ
jgi:hypothetical protein